MEATALKTTCKQCKGSGATISAQGEFAVASVCTCQLNCPRCEGSGRVYVQEGKYQFLKPCDCQKARQGVLLFNQAKIPSAFAEKDFDKFVGGPNGQLAIDLKQKAQAFCDTFIPHKTTTGLLFSGPVGTGKTHLLCAILQELALEVRVPCRFVEISFLYSEIRKGFSEGRSSLQIIEPLAEVPVLAIDELGKGKMSPFEMETIDELISRRYNAGRATLFSTNYSVADDAKPRPQFSSREERFAEHRGEVVSLKDRVGERVFSRLNQMCKFVVLPSTAHDYRRLANPDAAVGRPGSRG